MNLKMRAKQLTADIPALFLALKDPETPFTAKLVAWLTVAYALSPIDLLPDFIPVLGYLDDVLLLPLLVTLTVKCLPPQVLARSRDQAAAMQTGTRQQKWFFAIPIVLVTLGLVKKDPKCIFSTVAITMSIYTVVHFINVSLNNYCAANNILNPEGELVFANYMYSLAPNNPLVELFMQWIPGGYWHMYLAVPILVVYLLIVYLPDIIKNRKNKKCAV